MKITDSSYPLLDLTVAIIACLQIRLFGHGLLVVTNGVISLSHKGENPYVRRCSFDPYNLP
jgi:hypothetical protein